MERLIQNILKESKFRFLHSRYQIGKQLCIHIVPFVHYSLEYVLQGKHKLLGHFDIYPLNHRNHQYMGCYHYSRLG